MSEPTPSDSVWEVHGKKDVPVEFELTEEELAKLERLPPPEAQGSMSPSDLYLFHCDRYCVVPNSSIMKLLCSAEEACTPITEVDLTDNYIGSVGMLPLLEFCDNTPTLSAINLQQQRFTDKTVETLCIIFEDHTGLKSINLSKNPLGVKSARLLLDLLNKNPGIVHLNIDGTYISEDWQAKLQKAVQNNVNRSKR